LQVCCWKFTPLSDRAWTEQRQSRSLYRAAPGCIFLLHSMARSRARAPCVPLADACLCFRVHGWCLPRYDGTGSCIVCSSSELCFFLSLAAACAALDGSHAAALQSASCMQVDRRGCGVAMFGTREDMEDAVQNVDGTEMRNMRGSCVVRIVPARDGGRDSGGDRGRSRSRHAAVLAAVQLPSCAFTSVCAPALITCSCDLYVQVTTVMSFLLNARPCWRISTCVRFFSVDGNASMAATGSDPHAGVLHQEFRQPEFAVSSCNWINLICTYKLMKMAKMPATFLSSFGWTASAPCLSAFACESPPAIRCRLCLVAKFCTSYTPAI
jgi:hypothetical protein